MFIFPRLFHDFWPPDASSVGPNLVASAVFGVAAVFYAEFRVLKQMTKHHETTRREVHDAIRAALHPATTAEQHVADDVEEDLAA